MHWILYVSSILVLCYESAGSGPSKFMDLGKKESQIKAVKKCAKEDSILPMFDTEAEFADLVAYLQSAGLDSVPVPTGYFWDAIKGQWRTRSQDTDYECGAQPFIGAKMHDESQTTGYSRCLYVWDGLPTVLTCKFKHAVVCQYTGIGYHLCKYDQLGGDSGTPREQMAACKGHDRRLPLFMNRAEFDDFIQQIAEMGLANTPVATGYIRTSDEKGWNTWSKVKGGNRYACYGLPEGLSPFADVSSGSCLFVLDGKSVPMDCEHKGPAICQADSFEDKCSGSSGSGSKSSSGSKSREASDAYAAEDIPAAGYAVPDAVPLMEAAAPAAAATEPPYQAPGAGDTVAVAYYGYYY